jgi:hypothetical protein
MRGLESAKMAQAVDDAPAVPFTPNYPYWGGTYAIAPDFRAGLNRALEHGD